MSLINKMLQDLDARGGGSSQGAATEVRPVADANSRRPVLLAAAIAALAVLAAGGYFGWRAMRPAAPVEGPKMVVIKQAEPVVAPPAPPAAPLPATPAPPVSVPAPEVREPTAAAPLESKAEARKRRAESRQAAQQAEDDEPDNVVPAKPRGKARPTGAQVLTPSAPRELSSQQRAENEYRRALAALQEGRLAEAMAGLEQTIFIDPRHEPARQTLVGLLLENKRNDEAMRHLQLGLSLDPKQPAMAMILARLQVEKGGPAIDTLLRTLPHAAGNAEYMGFLAAVLQRAQRHGEAAEQYQMALRLSPQNGVWWMGLGISLQADKRNADARNAYARARDSGTLTPELQGYVERKLKQLGVN